MICDQVGYELVYENHAGSERGYFYDSIQKNNDSKNSIIRISIFLIMFLKIASKKIYIVENHENLKRGQSNKVF